MGWVRDQKYVLNKDGVQYVFVFAYLYLNLPYLYLIFLKGLYLYLIPVFDVFDQK